MRGPHPRTLLVEEKVAIFAFLNPLTTKSEDEEEDSDASGISHSLRRSSRARKPVDYLSPSHPRPRASLRHSEVPYYLQERTPSQR